MQCASDLKIGGGMRELQVQTSIIIISGINEVITGVRGDQQMI